MLSGIAFFAFDKSYRQYMSTAKKRKDVTLCNLRQKRKYTLDVIRVFFSLLFRRERNEGEGFNELICTSKHRINDVDNFSSSFLVLCCPIFHRLWENLVSFLTPQNEGRFDSPRPPSCPTTATLAIIFTLSLFSPTRRTSLSFAAQCVRSTRNNCTI